MYNSDVLKVLQKPLSGVEAALSMPSEEACGDKAPHFFQPRDLQSLHQISSFSFIASTTSLNVEDMTNPLAFKVEYVIRSGGGYLSSNRRRHGTSSPRDSWLLLWSCSSSPCYNNNLTCL
jgi:hypothetical protein